MASYLLPPGSDIVTSRSRAGPEITYRSVPEPSLLITMSFSSHPPRPRFLPRAGDRAPPPRWHEAPSPHSPRHRSLPRPLAQVTEPLRPAGMKLAVLVNGGSASASEIVAGAVQDLDAGIVVGPGRTYGKGASSLPPVMPLSRPSTVQPVTLACSDGPLPCRVPSVPVQAWCRRSPRWPTITR